MKEEKQNESLKFEDIKKFAKEQDEKLKKTLMVILAGFSTGIGWRVRGDTGFGGTTGMIAPALLLNLLIFIYFSKEIKPSGLTIGIAVLLMASTANGWGTLNGQITGVLRAYDRPCCPGYDININLFSGVFAIFIVGFGWVALWATYMAMMFSRREYNFNDLIKFILIYIIVLLISELFIAHLIIPFVAPEAYELFKQSLIGAGVNQNPWFAYITHFQNDSWLESIAGGRNYAAMVSNLSSCIGVLVLSMIFRYFYKDKRASKITVILSLIFGISITLADLWLFWDLGGWGRDSLVAPWWVEGWVFWEYSTGFLGGLLSMWYLVFKVGLPHRNSNNDKNKENAERLIDKEGETGEISGDSKNFSAILPKHTNFWSIIIIVGAVDIYGIVSPFSERVGRQINDKALGNYILLALGLIVFCIGALYYLGKFKILRKSIHKLSRSLSLSFLAYLTIYMCIYILLINILSWSGPMNYIMLISYIIVLLIYLRIRKWQNPNLD
ncbi:MAG: hypothetical protein ACTSU2_15450 [Promethearchaeota archaeon]